MEIIKAKHAGFCFGVRRAIRQAEETMSSSKGPFYSLGPLIHNPQVVKDLAAKGIMPVDDLEKLPAGTVIIRSHGVSPAVLDQIKHHGSQVSDATCPFVRRAQEKARFMAEQGFRVVVVGEPAHPEVLGLLGWAGQDAIVIETEAQAKGLPSYDKVALVAQTTQPADKLVRIADIIRGKTNELVVCDTICDATRQRQEATAILAGLVDVMIVVGGKNSANTRKLAELSSQKGTPTYHIEDASDLKAQMLVGAEKVGISAGASTPDWIIEEVVRKMTEMEKEITTGEQAAPTDVKRDMPTETMSLEDGIRNIRRGEIVVGTVVQIKNDEVVVDVGGKSEGIIPLNELSYRSISDPSELLKVGDSIEVQVLRTENEEGHPVLSKKRVDRKLAWDKLEQYHREGHIITAKVVDVVKGGLLVDVGINGFVPASQVERGYVENLDVYLGRELRLKVIELNRAKNKVVLSQKVVLEEELTRKRQQTWENLEVNQIRKGIVRRLTNFGAFVDIGGVDGLLHVSEIAWGRINHPQEVLSEGQEIDVVVLNADPVTGKVSLGRKQILPNPWHTAAERYPVGAIVQGRVLRTAPFGAFVELEPGIEGLVHVSQLADRHVAKPEDVVSVGEIISVKVLSVDQGAQRMSLSLREAGGKSQLSPAVAEEAGNE